MSKYDIAPAIDKKKVAEEFNLNKIEGKSEMEIAPELKAALEEHIIDVAPQAEGNLEKRKQIGDAAFGAVNVEISRCSISIPRFVLRGGESVVLIGPNGAGKTTIFDAIMNLKDAHFDTKGGFGAIVYGRPEHTRKLLRIARLNQEEVLKKIGHLTARQVLEQAAYYFKNQFPVDWNNLEAYDENLANQEAQQRIEELISQVVKLFKMEEFLDRKVDQLSGGERTKLVLLTILASEPDVLLLDEPTNHLDMASITKLTGLFDKYKRAGVTVLSVSHVDWFLRQAGQDGTIEIIREGEKREVRQSGAPYTNYIKDRSRPKSEFGGNIEWMARPEKYGKTVIPIPEIITIPNSPLKEVKIPSISYGEIVFLIGDNGTGKTKLLEAMRGGREIPREKGINIAYLPQFWPSEVAEGTVEEFYEWILRETDPVGALGKDEKEQIRLGQSRNRFIKELSRFGGREGRMLLKRPLASLSGGEQRLLWMLAVSSQGVADVLLLDEPTNHMDRGLQAKVIEAIRNFKGAVVIATHDIDLIEALVRDSGVFRTPTKPRNFVFTKENDRTKIEEKKDILSYIEEKIAEAKRVAKRVQI